MIGVEHQIAALAAMSTAGLRDGWRELTASPVPRVSPANAAARPCLGDPGKGARRAEPGDRPHSGPARRAAKTRTSPVSPGMRLVREWAGKVHVVLVGDDGVIRWVGRDWGSLSEVARMITGTRWSGPAFFGLKRKVAA